MDVCDSLCQGRGGELKRHCYFSLQCIFWHFFHSRLSFPILTKFYCIVVNVAISSNVKVRNEGTTKIKISSEEKTMEKTVLLKPSTLDCVTDSSNLPKSSICDIAAVIWTIFLNFGEFPKKSFILSTVISQPYGLHLFSWSNSTTKSSSSLQWLKNIYFDKLYWS